VRKATLAELESALQRYIQFLLEGPLRSRKFYSEVSQPPAEGGV
jgi:hypothetical protein